MDVNGRTGALPMKLASTLRFSIEGPIARLTLARPTRKNAINAEMHSELRDVLQAVEENTSLRVLVICGEGNAFCSGQDLSERASALEAGKIDLARSIEQNYNPLIRRLAGLPIPILSEVRGVAAGAGAAIALSADIVVAARSATFQLAFSRIGLNVDSGLSWLLPRLVGQARALGMALTAESIDAQRAEAWGLIWRAVDDEHLTSEVGALAKRLAEGPKAALATIKKRIRAAAEETLNIALDAERDTQGELGRLADYHEGVTAFMQKRSPKFS